MRLPGSIKTNGTDKSKTAWHHMFIFKLRVLNKKKQFYSLLLRFSTYWSGLNLHLTIPLKHWQKFGINLFLFHRFISWVRSKRIFALQGNCYHSMNDDSQSQKPSLAKNNISQRLVPSIKRQNIKQTLAQPAKIIQSHPKVNIQRRAVSCAFYQLTQRKLI